MRPTVDVRLQWHVPEKNYCSSHQKKKLKAAYLFYCMLLFPSLTGQALPDYYLGVTSLSSDLFCCGHCLALLVVSWYCMFNKISKVVMLVFNWNGLGQELATVLTCQLDIFLVVCRYWLKSVLSIFVSNIGFAEWETMPVQWWLCRRWPTMLGEGCTTHRQMSGKQWRMWS